ncbi:MAG: hypothetical protein Q9214_000895 [Letrouitia sp. 1 TL-2023]
MENISTSPDSTETAGKGRDELGSDAIDNYDHEKSAFPQSSQSSSCQNFGPRDESRPQVIVKKLLKGKEKEWTATVEKDRPLQLLDLPLDILKEIVKEVIHTNDLTSLALTCSALHSLAIPLIYSRFDIVWPDVHNSSESRQGVDALTYGLATLVMGEQGTHLVGSGDNCSFYTCSHCGMVNAPTSVASAHSKRRRRGNYYPQFTRKFSLGNGPPDWIRDYYSWSEGGKMLGTLVALAIARMPNLESFTWSMPTGILRDVWLALASLGDGRYGQESRLDRIWVRLHDNREYISAMGISPPVAALQTTPASSGTSSHLAQTPAGDAVNESSLPTLLEWSYRNVEYPNFSILPPLKSLNVLNIDEVAYLEELSILIENSLDTLRELRLGLSVTVSDGKFASTRQGNFATENTFTAPMAAGGVIGVLMSKFYNCAEDNRHPTLSLEDLGISVQHTDGNAVAETLEGVASASATTNKIFSPPEDIDAPITAAQILSALPESSSEPNFPEVSTEDQDVLITGSRDGPTLPFIESEKLSETLNDSNSAATFRSTMLHNSSSLISDPLSASSNPLPAMIEQKERGSNKTSPCHDLHVAASQIEATSAGRKRRRLTLETLELERISISVAVLQRTIDWSILTSLTLLHCGSHDLLWKALRRRFAPQPISSSVQASSSSSSRCKTESSLRDQSLSGHSKDRQNTYSLALKRIHTNTVSSALMTFLKETLAPNSLEWLLLQDCAVLQGARDPYDSAVSIESIYRGPLRRHRSSLKKVMVDSGDGTTEGRPRDQKWRKWKLSREVLAFVTSGKMGALRELAMAVDYKDWHYFLQRLPQIPHLRSIYIPHIADHVYAHNVDAKELALQLIDIVALRPEMELCYMGIATKCFEILEGEDASLSGHDLATTPVFNGPDEGDSNEDSDDDHENDDDNDDATATAAVPPSDAGGSETDSQNGSLGNSDDESVESEGGRRRPKFKLREILFYDDKVTIFKARHGRL